MKKYKVLYIIIVELDYIASVWHAYNHSELPTYISRIWHIIIVELPYREEEMADFNYLTERGYGT